MCNVTWTSRAHSSCLESLDTLSLYDELSAAVEEGMGEHSSWEELWFLVVLDNASLLLPRNTAAAVFNYNLVTSLVLRALVMGQPSTLVLSLTLSPDLLG